MEKSHEELEKELARVNAELEQYQHEDQQLANRIKYYQQGDRKKQNRRLITCGAAVESIVPEVRGMSERDFFILMEHIFSLSKVTAMVSHATDQQKGGQLALFHLYATQVKRSTGQSVVISAVYRAGKKLYSEYYGEVNDCTRNKGYTV